MEEEKPNPTEYFCAHEDCPDHGVVGKGNITLSHRYGKQRKYLLWCKTCERTFSEKRGTIFYGLHTPKEKVLLALHCIAEGNNIASTARIIGSKEDTVRNWLRRAGEQSEQVSQLLIKELKLGQAKLDKLWAYIKKEERQTRRYGRIRRPLGVSSKQGE